MGGLGLISTVVNDDVGWKIKVDRVVLVFRQTPDK
jgi:hypothetical protein